MSQLHNHSFRKRMLNHLVPLETHKTHLPFSWKRWTSTKIITRSYRETFDFNKKRRYNTKLQDPNKFCHCYNNFFSKKSFRNYLITAIFKVYFQELRDPLKTAFERYLITEDFTDMDQRRCQACTNTFNLLFYASLSLKQA